MNKEERSVLIVEDEASLRVTLCDYLTSKGFHCLVAQNLSEAESFYPSDLKVALIDIGLPDGSGLDFAKTLRTHCPKTVIFFLSALTDPETRLNGLEIGAMDYITKPFELKELLLRLQRVLKLQDELTREDQVIELGSLKILFSQFKVIDANQKVIELSRKECEILKLLYQNKNSSLSRDKIIDEIWGENSYPSHRTVDNYIVKLRKWSETDQSQKINIKSIRGIGYMMEIK